MGEKIKKFWTVFWNAFKEGYNKAFKEPIKELVQEYRDTKRVNLIAIVIEKLNNFVNAEVRLILKATARKQSRCKSL